MVCSFPNFTALFESGIQDEIVRRLIRQRLGLVFSITPRKAWTPLKLGNSQMLLISLKNRNRFHWISGDFTITGSLSVAAHLSRQEALPAQCTPHTPATGTHRISEARCFFVFSQAARARFLSPSGRGLTRWAWTRASCPSPSRCSRWVTWRCPRSWSARCSPSRWASWWSRSHCRPHSPRWSLLPSSCSCCRPWAGCCFPGRLRTRSGDWGLVTWNGEIVKRKIVTV